jgi:hypothetical protein
VFCYNVEVVPLCLPTAWLPTSRALLAVGLPVFLLGELKTLFTYFLIHTQVCGVGLWVWEWEAEGVMGGRCMLEKGGTESRG